MKTSSTLIVTFTVLLFHLCVTAQQTIIPVVDGKMNHSWIREVKSSKRSLLYEIAMKWMSNDGRITIDDSTNGILVGYKTVNLNVGWHLTYTCNIKIQVKEGKYKAEITDVYNGEYHIDNALNNPVAYKSGVLKKSYKKDFKEVMEVIGYIVKGLDEQMSKAKMDDF